MLDLIGFRSGAKRSRLISRGLAVLLVLSICTLASQAEAADKGGSGNPPTMSGGVGCAQEIIELDDGTEVVLPAADPASCPKPTPVDCETFLGAEPGTLAEASNRHQVRAVCVEYPKVLISECPGNSDLHPQLTLPNATVIHGDHEQLDILLDVLFDDFDLGGLLAQYTDPSNPRFYSAASGLGYAVVPLDAAALEQIIDTIGVDRLRLSPVHVYQGHKMSRGHPVDEFEDLGITGYRPPRVDPGSMPVVVVDAGGSPGDGGVRGHGEFASEVARAEGLDTDLVTFDVRVNNFFDDTDIVPALLDGFFGPDPMADSNYPQRTVVNLSFGAYNCGLATDWLTDALERLIGNGHQIVASAGNSETNELVFPAALAIDWTAYTTNPVYTESNRALPKELHKTITSVGSVTDSGDRSCFSNYGVWVEKWFPGEEVYAQDTISRQWGGTWSGTSFAAPQAAAAMANGKLPRQTAPAALTTKYEHKIAPSGDILLSYCADGSGYEPR